MKEAIVISVPSNHPLQLYHYIEQELNLPNFKVKIVKTEHGVMAGIEWAIPTAIVAYLLKPFFEAFLQEAGKDFYELTKSNLKKFVLTNRALKYKYIAASTSPEKLSKKYDQSVTVSLKAKVHPNILVTVLIDEDIAEEEANQMLESMFGILGEIYHEFKKQEEIDGPVRSSQQKEVYLVANISTKKWEILTFQQMSERYRN
ncbi:MAG: hypothetical protein EOO45_00475 [Flavobacterium sp.]|nr:MAG: hypothetical protein EOO45_00475 [Flavobacterium sp.]